MVEVKAARTSKAIDTGRALSVGEVARRSGVAVSALHFYEAKGLISCWRNAGNQRRYARHVLRRVALIRVAQRVGLPSGKAPAARDWRRLATGWKGALDERIRVLQRLRDEFEGCIGCGCLLLRDCPLRNPGDKLGRSGRGAVLLDGEP